MRRWKNAAPRRCRRGAGATPDNADDLGRLDADAIATVRDEAWPQARDADELHGVLMDLGFISATELAAQPLWQGWLEELAVAGRATTLRLGEDCVHVATERVPVVLAVLPDASVIPAVTVPSEFAETAWTRDEALRELLRARLPALGRSASTHWPRRSVSIRVTSTSPCSRCKPRAT